MSHRKVWIVMGEHSNYSENYTWIDSVWSSRKAALARSEEQNQMEARRRHSRDSYEVVAALVNKVNSLEYLSEMVEQ